MNDLSDDFSLKLLRRNIKTPGLATHFNDPRRIHELDAIRGFALFGIFIIHFFNGFGTPIETLSNSFNQYLSILLSIFFDGRFSATFSILFGVSFHIILNKYDARNESHSKFAWRSILLILIGLFCKYFYTSEILMLYGFLGILLIPFYRFGKKLTLYLSILFFLLSPFVSLLKLGTLLFPDAAHFRNEAGIGFIDYFSRLELKYYFQDILNYSFLKFFSFFTFGVYLGKSLIIFSLPQYIKEKRVLLKSFIITLIILIIQVSVIALTKLRTLDQPTLDSIKNLRVFLLDNVFLISTTFLYVSVFIYLYEKIALFRLFEAYGKLGLTNYIIHSIIGVILIYDWGFGLNSLPVISRIALSTLVYIVGLTLSLLYLNSFKYGPFEWAWRCLTDLKWYPFRLIQKQK